MKRTQLLVLAVLALGLQGISQASPFPADAVASHNLRSPNHNLRGSNRNLLPLRQRNRVRIRKPKTLTAAG